MSPALSIYNPAELGTPLGPYSQVARVKASELLFIAGMVAVDANGELVATVISRPRPARSLATSTPRCARRARTGRMSCNSPRISSIPRTCRGS
jgi:hypothetical protein